MDVVSKVTANGLNATVVRQFVPTRIEREVLAHVFAIVYGGAREEWGATRQAEASKCLCEDEDHPTEAHVTGRRAA